MKTTDDKHAALMEIGKGAMSSLREMVAALECDYDRLQELKDERDELFAEWKQARDDEDAALNGAPDADHDNAKTVTVKNAALEEWDAENLADLRGLVEDAGDCKDREDAQQRIDEDPLSLRIFGERVDGEWEADKFEILLTTGGPAVRIMGDLSEHNEPTGAWLEVQDWGTPWTEYYETGVGDVCLAYARCFCFE